jgi:hypothetical protein
MWFFLGMQGSIKGAPAVDLTAVSTPERHFSDYRKKRAAMQQAAQRRQKKRGPEMV